MSVDSLKPKTLAGIKSLAIELKSLHKLSHHEAQRQASIRAGFQNLEHARNELKKSAVHTNEVYVSNYWSDERIGQSGRLTFSVPLPITIRELLGLQGARIDDQYLAAYKLEFDDHIELRHDRASYSEAKELGQSVALALQFMAKTGLRSANGNILQTITKFLRSGMHENGDMSVWVYPAITDSWVILDEPHGYRGPVYMEAPGVYAEQCHGFGIHRGGGLRTTVIAHSQDIASGVVTALKAIHEGKQNIIQHEGLYRSEFVSPLRKKSGMERKSRPMPHPEGTVKNNSIAYGGIAGDYSNWRPDFKLPIAAHLKIGPILGSVKTMYFMSDYQLISRIRLDLRNWFFLEHGAEITLDLEQAYNGSSFLNAEYKLANPFYTASKNVEPIETVVSKLTNKNHAAIETIISILTNGYPPCRAVDKQVERLRKVQSMYPASS